ncbi:MULTISPECIES: YebC/PmpR family DNA-binding transcriptional regulator [Hymenobacter]|uniref:Probable transcriptional regulatory protein FHG12_01490 n=1 Tax=Hymenobacter jejuensis TaxID=2502781 RepID=A0A5B7ZVM5_9BACT|nr:MULTISPECIES: YebC/PmpR family DNA-binding transcriptional regulator [Hymenobacter]MBC6988840.1 YebC/PmpR family DNA-binding transcriptional regulator [Hymenobacter sp. BT491]QDA58849.1 YebC/PmpR family DNA-binding transcriptional regulator [Hymenobacter jejuensis]
MGRAFEFRKGRKMKRWDRMSKDFTRIGKEIVMAVKENGPNPDTNARLRTAMQNAKGVNMPKDRVEAAIKRASSKEEKDYEEVVYEGYAPHGIAVVVECATDNPVRTVSNVRMYFNRGGGSLGTAGSSDYTFTRKGVFKLAAEGLDRDELELELIDFGAEDVYLDEEEDEHGATKEIMVIETAFTDFGQMQKALEDKGLHPLSATLQRVPNTTVTLSDEEVEEVMKLIDKFEEDDDVQAVYHTMG